MPVGGIGHQPYSRFLDARPTRFGSGATPTFSTLPDPIVRLSFDEILTIANYSMAKTRVFLLDSCCSGYLGAPSALDGTSSKLSEGLSIFERMLS